MFDKAPLPKHIVMVILVVMLAIMLGGYGLYYSSKKQMVQKEREYEIQKEKAMHAEENFNELKKKFDATANDLTSVNKDYEVLLQKHQECKEKQDELQTKKDELVQENGKLKEALTDAQIKLGITPNTVTSSENVHPVQLLNKSKEDDKAQATATKGFSCPSSEIVTKNAPLGTWKDNAITWWVEFTSRPLFENETVKDLFKIIYDGHGIACYYALTSDNSNSIWMVVKADLKGKQSFKLSEKGWSLCPTDECKSLCDKDHLKECTFTIE